MSWLYLLLLAIIQGLTEFLPVSSSAHLILPAQIFGWDDQGPLIDVMAHFGSLFAVMIYFRKDVVAMFSGFFDLLRRKLNRNSALTLNLMISFPPAALFGYFLHNGGYDLLVRAPLIIATTTIVFGVMLWIVDITYKREHTMDDITWKQAVFLGFAQAFALIPGTSRSGITMTAGRYLGITRVESAHFSMLMSLPIIGAGGLVALMELISEPSSSQFGIGPGLVVAFLSFLTAYAAISVFMKWVSKIGFLPFMIYRLILGFGILAWMFWVG